MPVEPWLRPVLALDARLPKPAAGTLMPQRRAASERTNRLLGPALMRGARRVDVADVEVAVDGGRITVRLYRPAGAGAVTSRLPLHVYLHGGGWCVGSLADVDPRCRTTAARAGCVVASVDYRLAPENQFPVGLEDAYAALTWLVGNADELGIDPRRVSIGGESAGANLATVCCLLARDRGGPDIALQVLVVPATDATLSQPSVDEMADGYLLTRRSMEEFTAAYLPAGASRTDPLASPLHADDLTRLPPAVIHTAEYDPLRDEGEAYARRLADAGVAVRLRRLTGHVHHSFAFTRLLASARDAERERVAAVRYLDVERFVRSSD